MVYKSRQAAIKLFKEYSLIAYEAKHKEKYGERLKISSAKRMLQRFPIALAQVKASKTSENLLNKSQINNIFFVLKKIH